MTFGRLTKDVCWSVGKYGKRPRRGTGKILSQNSSMRAGFVGLNKGSEYSGECRSEDERRKGVENVRDEIIRTYRKSRSPRHEREEIRKHVSQVRRIKEKRSINVEREFQFHPYNVTVSPKETED